MFRDGVLKSIWQSEVVFRENSRIDSEIYDVVIAGGGITGFSCAFNLQKMGFKCLVLEAENAGFGTTGGTTAHLNTFFDATYPEVIKDFGLDNAKLLANSGKEAIQIIKLNIAEYNIGCNFEDKTAYLFATDEQQEKELNDIVDASNQVEIDMQFCEENPFPVPFRKVAKISGQAQFHPLRYINGLRKAFMNMGGSYIEKCRVTDYSKEDDYLNISTSINPVKAKHLIYATHTPPGINLLHFRNIPWRSYVLAVELNDLSYPSALGYDLNDPYHYYRSQEINGKWYLIAGGKDHKTGDKTDSNQVFEELEMHVRQHFDVKNVAFKWSSQFYEPVDGLPYIGKIPNGPDNVFVASGYNGNGMIFGTLAGKILSDLIFHQQSIYEELFNPGRIKAIAGFSKFTSHNLNVASTWIKDKISKEHIKNLASLEDNEGKVISYEGNSYAVYKDPAGNIHALKNLCPHALCSVEFNNAELTWDCPCHGSRFGIKGNVLNAPSVTPLEQIDLEEDEKLNTN